VIKPEISIIILTWNALHHLKRFLPSVHQFQPDYAEVIIADNASDDGTGEYIKEHYPGFRHLLLDRNYGYCKGNNLASEAARGQYLLILNNDVEVSEGWLDPVMQMFREEPETAVIQPRLRSVEKPDYFEYGGAAGGLLDHYGYPFCRGRIFDELEKDTGQYSENADIFWASGAAFAVRKEIFLEFGGFEERYEFHMEEIDLCWRLLNSGYKIRYCAGSTVYHLGGGSLPTGSYRKVYFNYRNNLAMMFRNLPSGGIFTRLPVRILLDFISAFRSLFKGELIVFRAILASHISFCIWLPALIRQRSRLQRQRMISTDPETLWRGSIVWKYFVRGKKIFSDF
jgi:GT2 family glycosyltransferase